jgi:DNA-directed RNA polymerase subunit RPC12/RpoP
MDNTGDVFVSSIGTFTSDGSLVCAPCGVFALDAGSEMVTLGTIARCPRCRSRPTVQSAVALRPGVEYLTLRCASCGLVYDAQAPSDPTRLATLAKAEPPVG